MPFMSYDLSVVVNISTIAITILCYLSSFTLPLSLFLSHSFCFRLSLTLVARIARILPRILALMWNFCGVRWTFEHAPIGNRQNPLEIAYVADNVEMATDTLCRRFLLFFFRFIVLSPSCSHSFSLNFSCNLLCCLHSPFRIQYVCVSIFFVILYANLSFSHISKEFLFAVACLPASAMGSANAIILSIFTATKNLLPIPFNSYSKIYWDKFSSYLFAQILRNRQSISINWSMNHKNEILMRNVHHCAHLQAWPNNFLFSICYLQQSVEFYFFIYNFSFFILYPFSFGIVLYLNYCNMQRRLKKWNLKMIFFLPDAYECEHECKYLCESENVHLWNNLILRTRL